MLIFGYRIVTTSLNRDHGGECPYVWILLYTHSDLCMVTIVSIFKLKNICIKSKSVIYYQPILGTLSSSCQGQGRLILACLCHPFIPCSKHALLKLPRLYPKFLKVWILGWIPDIPEENPDISKNLK